MFPLLCRWRGSPLQAAPRTGALVRCYSLFMVRKRRIQCRREVAAVCGPSIACIGRHRSGSRLLCIASGNTCCSCSHCPNTARLLRRALMRVSGLGMGRTQRRVRESTVATQCRLRTRHLAAAYMCGKCVHRASEKYRSEQNSSSDMVRCHAQHKQQLRS